LFFVWVVVYDSSCIVLLSLVDAVVFDVLWFCEVLFGCFVILFEIKI